MRTSKSVVRAVTLLARVRTGRGAAGMGEKQHFRNFVDGQWQEAGDGRTTDLVDPVRGEVYASAPLSGAEDVDRAYAAAATAFDTWRDTTPGERQSALLKLADAIEARAGEFVAVESPNTGKPIGLTTDEEIPPAVDQIRF